MSDQVLTDSGALALLNIIFNNTRAAGGNNLTLRLFINDRTPADTDTASNYTEATGGGYAAKTLSLGAWAVSIAASISQAVYLFQSFVFTGPLNGSASIYGAYITDADGTLITAQKCATSFTPATNGDYFDVTPKIKLSKGTPS